MGYTYVDRMISVLKYLKVETQDRIIYPRVFSNSEVEQIIKSFSVAVLLCEAHCVEIKMLAFFAK
jgi:hypothetical protein